MKLFRPMFLHLLALCGLTYVTVIGSVVITVTEDSDVVLPCSPSSMENLESEQFKWKKDGNMEVLIYDGSNGYSGQTDQFVGRVSYFPVELKNGNASIQITNTKVADSGNYTCDFPHLQPRQTFSIQLVVDAAFKITVTEESDVVLPCSPSSMENLGFKRFDWKKDSDMKVFIYDAGLTYGNGFTGQDEKFVGRVSHFPEELRNGNASIKITNTELSDSGTYTCIFPRLQPSQTFSIQLVVDDCILRDRTGIPGAYPKPHTRSLEEKMDWSLLQCEVYGASPEPEVEWRDSSGNKLPAEEPQVTERGGKYDVILQTTVDKSDHYSCVVTQNTICHQVNETTYVYVHGPPSAGWALTPLCLLVFICCCLSFV